MTIDPEAAGDTRDPGSDPASLDEDPRVPREVDLPLRDLDRALAPIRRVVRFAMEPGGLDRVRFLGANLDPHLKRALRLDLPEALREPLAVMAGQAEGFDADGPEGRRRRLSALYSNVARLDALAGLPLNVPPRPVPKRVVPSRPEPEPASGLDAVAREAPPRRAAEAPPEEEEELEEDEAGELTGDPSQSLAEWLAPDLAERLARHGVRTLRDLTQLRPVSAEVLEPVHGAGRQIPEGTPDGARVAVGGRLQGGFTVFVPGGPPQRWSRLVGAGPVHLRWREESAPWRDRDRKVVVTATHASANGPDRLVDAEVAGGDGASVRLARWGLEGVADHELRAVWRAIGESRELVRDPVSPELLRRLSLVPSAQALVSAQERVEEEGRRRLAFDEALLTAIGGILPRLQAGRERGIAHSVLHGFAGRTSQTFELELHDDAQATLEEIKRDLRRTTPMRRVVTGEVGSGKGRIALLASGMVSEEKGQVLIVCADAADAETRFLHTESLLREEGLVGRVVTSAPGGSVRDAIKRGEVHAVFGTIELLEQGLEFRRLGLVLAFEREGWGRASALHAALPAPRPDLLVFTAVPVGPRVLATAYADHHVSVVVDPERRPAAITVVRADERSRAYARIREAVAAGAQGVVVVPMVDGRDAVEIPDALRLVRALQADALAGLEVGLLHGAMPREERARVHDDFQHRRMQVLVSTTRVEDAPTIPGASVVVVEQADRFDQVRLHRIIGFFSRSRRAGEAVLVVGELAEPDAAARIERIVAAPDGFQLTEALVVLRGVDRTIAAGAPPLPRTTWLDWDRDRDLVIAAREEAHRILRADPAMRRGTHIDLARELKARWTRFWPDTPEWACLLRDEPAVEPKRRRRRRRKRKT